MAQDEPVMQEESVPEETEAEGVPEEDTSLEENPVSDQEEWELPGGSNRNRRRCVQGGRNSFEIY